MTRPLLSTEERLALRAELEAEAWRRGRLRHLLHSDQQRVYDHIRSTTGRFVMEIARRYGKTWLLLVLAFEACLRKPKARVVYGAPTLKHLAEFILPTVEKLSALAPEALRPRYNPTTGHLEFHNESVIHLFGADDKRKADRGRGPEADLAIFDEAGFTPVLRYVLRSIFRPQLLHTGGRVLLGSTPAETPDHDFTVAAEQAEATGNYCRRTIHDNPMLTPERIAAFIAEDARDEGLTVEAYMDSDEFRREYLAERVIDRLLVVVPEWKEHGDANVGTIERPTYFDAWVSLDMGGADPHAVTFGYWHFRAARNVVERELLLKGGENTEQLASRIRAVEKELWGTTRWEGTVRGATDNALFQQLPEWMRDALDEEAPQQPYWRISDNDLHLVRDLYELHGLTFCPTAKDDKEMQVNNFRVMVAAHQWLISPACVHTIRHCAQTTWANGRRMTYSRRAGEHGDLLDTLVYEARNLVRRNPEPPELGLSAGQSIRAKLRAQQEAEDMGEAMLGDSTLARRLMGR